jgi:uridine kinase
MSARPSSPLPRRLVAIVGGTGAGKGWMAGRLCRLLGEQACHLSLDNFYHDRSHLTPARRERVNFDNPRAIDWDCAHQVLQDCLAGQTTRVPRYDFRTHTRLDAAPWQPKPLVFAEGLWLLTRPATRRLFTLKIYLDCPDVLRLSRRRARDAAERGRAADAVEHRLRLIAPLHERYVEPQKKWADLVIRQPFSESDLTRLAEAIWALLKDDSQTAPGMHQTFCADLLTLLDNDENND